MVYSRWYCSICNIRGCVVRLRIFCALFDHGLGLRFGFGGYEWKHQSPVEFCSAKGRQQNAGPLLLFVPGSSSCCGSWRGRGACRTSHSCRVFMVVMVESAVLSVRAGGAIRCGCGCVVSSSISFAIVWLWRGNRSAAERRSSPDPSDWITLCDSFILYDAFSGRSTSCAWVGPRLNQQGAARAGRFTPYRLNHRAQQVQVHRNSTCDASAAKRGGGSTNLPRMAGSDITSCSKTLALVGFCLARSLITPLSFVLLHVHAELCLAGKPVVTGANCFFPI